MRGLRNLVFDRLTVDPGMVGLGYSANNIYPIHSRDSTPIAVEGKHFLTLRWGVAEVALPGVPVSGMPVPVGLQVWAYNQDPDYGPIDDALQRVRIVIDSITSQAAGSGWVLGSNWLGSGPDLFDDLYAAYTRYEEYRITASGN